ncbi:MAG: hypothetical protein IKV76_03775 [Clostridia bacterium]|nr:hypothetical protein [Clostridia bacterium]
MNGVIIAAIICGTVIILSLFENRKSSYKRKYDALVTEMENKEDVYNQFLKLALPGNVIKFVNWGYVGYCLTTECLYRFQGEKMIVYNRDDEAYRNFCAFHKITVI